MPQAVIHQLPDADSHPHTPPSVPHEHVPNPSCTGSRIDSMFLCRDRIRRATDPARQRELAAARPPYLPRASDLRPTLLLVRCRRQMTRFHELCHKNKFLCKYIEIKN